MLLKSIHSVNSVCTSVPCFLKLTDLLPSLVEAQNGSHTLKNEAPQVYSTRLLAVQLVDVQAIFDSSCVNVVEAQNGSQEIFNVFSSSDTKFS